MSLLTADEVAELFKVSKATVKRRVQEGKLPYVETAFGMRFRASEITARRDDADIDGERARLRTKLLVARDALDAIVEEL